MEKLNKNNLVYLCQCNKCGNILFDENPQVDSQMYIAPKGTLSMVQVDDSNDFFWACPICRTDKYLIDL